ncbi:hypothetical protein ACFT5B_06835 [Luteimicrobium sp. NPDC057192]|uniref:hypothetical protein n=1 Tax=Luteimicrobium sp. NPDC057192 TaxID=3346042 RepID=UPI00363D9C54
MSALTFTVRGIPAPKGSLRHVGHGRMIEQITATKPWMDKVRDAALDSAQLAGWVAPAAVSVDVLIVVPRPKTVRRSYPITRSSGDLDKHCRAVLDALSEDRRHGRAGVLPDDSTVIDLSASKRYPSVGLSVGAVITIREAS